MDGIPELEEICPDLLRLHADPQWLHVPEPSQVSTATLCGQGNRALEVLTMAASTREAGDIRHRWDETLRYAHYALTEARQTLDAGDTASGVAQLADALPSLCHLREALRSARSAAQ